MSRKSRSNTLSKTEYKVDRAMMFVFYISMASIVVQMLVHFSDMPEFASKYALFLAFEASIIVVTRIHVVNIVDPKEINWWTVTWVSSVGVISLFLMQAAIGFITRVKFALADWEIYLFYVNAAIAEECLYRATLITFLDKILIKMVYFNEQPVIRKVVLIVASASLFGMSHYWVYGQQPELMLVAFLGGIILSFCYVMSKNPMPPVIAHVTNNLAASYNVIQGMSVLSVAFVTSSMAWLLPVLVVLGFVAVKRRQGSHPKQETLHFFGLAASAPIPARMLDRTHPAAVMKLDVYRGTMDELSSGFDSSKTCGWCGKSLGRVKVIYECTYDGFSHCSQKCQELMDNWIMNNVIDPEGEIDDLPTNR